MKILMALSGGIDSSVVAHMLAEQGHELIGVRFTLWSDPLAPPIANVLPSKCCNTQTAFRAQKTAETLGIPYHIVDLQDEFKKHVVDPFLEGYSKGTTPNPCIGCNRTIKFGKLLDLAKEYGCDAMATGHYARVARETLSDGTERHLLLEAFDASKDQSYYLYGLTQEQLRQVLFPLGGMLKADVFALASQYGVPYDDISYSESQDLCFFPEKEPTEFLKRHLKDVISPGNIIRKDGTVVGTHKGLPLYTIGQRKGLGVGGLKIPLEVVQKDPTTNELIVEEKGSTHLPSVEVRDLRWVSWKPDQKEQQFDCRVRSLSPKISGSITYEGSRGVFHFSSPQPPLATGQSIVLYRGEEVVGGGVMHAA